MWAPNLRPGGPADDDDAAEFGNGLDERGGAGSNVPALARRDKTREAILEMEARRAERRKNQRKFRKEIAAEKRRNEREGRPGDVLFQRMIRAFRRDHAGDALPFERKRLPRICIAVRTRPVNEKERTQNEFSAVTCLNPRVYIHNCRYRVDGITRYLENSEFRFDYSFGPDDSTQDMYGPTVEPLVHRVLTRGGNGTCFAYGQTGSGKTYTMQGLQRLAVQQLFEGRHGLARGGAGLRLFVSCFEIYGGRCLDLLHDRARLHVREDGQGVVQIAGLEEEEVGSRTACEQLLEEAARRRTTHVTAVHAQSSRSHAILTLALRGPRGEDRGKLSLIDLAGSERASETSSHDRQLRAEGAEINKSLLGLKECIRAMDREDLTHVPYRASKLTLVLKDSFTSPNSRTVMIATVSPTHAAADHSLNTLRYADRIKEKKVHAPVTPARGYGGSGFSDDSHMDGRPDATALVAGSSDDDDGGLEELGRPSGDDDGVGETGSDDTEGEEEARVMPQRPGPRRRRRVRDVPARWLRAQGREETRPLPDTGLHRGGPALSGAAGDSGVGVTASAGARAPAPLRGLSADDFDAIPPQTASSGEDERGWAAGEGRDGEEEEGNRGAQSPTRRSSGGNRPPAPVRDGTTGRGARAGREGEGGKRQPGLLGRIFRFGRRATGSGSQRRGTEDGGGGGDDEGEARKGQYSAESEAEGEAEVARRRSAPKAQEEEEGKVEGEERGAETGAHSAWSVAQRRAPGGPSSARRGASLLEPGPRRAREPRSADDVRGRRSGAGRKAGSSGGGRSADPTLTPPLTREDSGPRARAGRLKPRLQPTPGAEGKAGAGDGSPGEGQVATARREDDEDEGEDEERGGHSGGRRASPQPPRAHRPRRPGPPASSSSAQASAERSPSLWVATPEAVEGTAPYRPGRRISPQATVVAAEGTERSAAASPSDAGGAGQKEGQGAALASPPDHGVRARPVTSPSPSKHTHLRDRADWQRGAGQGAVPLSPAAKRLRAARRLELEGHISSQERSRLKEAILKREEWAGEGRSKVVPPSPDHASSLSVAAAVEPRLEPRIVLPDQQPTAEARFGAADTVAAAPRGEGGDRAATRHHRSPQGGRGGDRGAQGGLERVHSAVQELVDEEDMLVASHGRHIENHRALLEKEERLAARIQGEHVVDYDVDEYVAGLEEVNKRRRELCADMDARLARFKLVLARKGTSGAGGRAR